MCERGVLVTVTAYLASLESREAGTPALRAGGVGTESGPANRAMWNGRSLSERGANQSLR